MDRPEPTEGTKVAPPLEGQVSIAEAFPENEDLRVWSGPEGYGTHLEPIGAFQPHPLNPGKEYAEGWSAERHIAELQASLQRYGQRKPVVVTDRPLEKPDLPENTILAGHHVKEAAAKLGWTHIAVMRVDPGNFQEAINYMVTDNRLTAVMDLPDVYSLLKELPPDELPPGYAVEEVQDMADQLDLSVESSDKVWKYAEDDDTAAERLAHYKDSVRHQEFFLNVPLAEADDFTQDVTVLVKAWGTSFQQAVIRACKQAADAERAK